jgi:uncharacterized protein
LYIVDASEKFHSLFILIIMELGNAINWFEIPVNDFDRAKKFYESIFSYQMPENQMGPARMGFLLHDYQNGKVGGAIVHNPSFYTPSTNGSLVYLNCQPDLQVVIDRVENAGGEILMKKTIIAPDQHLGYWALIRDTEGNRVALHSMQ